jgi:hypothetical protein
MMSGAADDGALAASVAMAEQRPAWMMSDPRAPDPVPNPIRPSDPPEMPLRPEPIDVPSPEPDNVPPPNEPIGVPLTQPPEIPVVPTTTASGPKEREPHPQRRPVTMPARSTSTFSRFGSSSVV